MGALNMTLYLIEVWGLLSTSAITPNSTGGACGLMVILGNGTRDQSSNRKWDGLQFI